MLACACKSTAWNNAGTCTGIINYICYFIFNDVFRIHEYKIKIFSITNLFVYFSFILNVIIIILNYLLKLFL